MSKMNEMEALSEKIISLQNKQKNDLKLFKDHIEKAIDDLKPSNLIKNTFEEVSGNSELKTNILNGTMGLLVGYIVKKIIVGKSKNTKKIFLANLIQLSVTTLVGRLHVFKSKNTYEND